MRIWRRVSGGVFVMCKLKGMVESPSENQRRFRDFGLKQDIVQPFHLQTTNRFHPKYHVERFGISDPQSTNGYGKCVYVRTYNTNTLGVWYLKCVASRARCQ